MISEHAYSFAEETRRDDDGWPDPLTAPAYHGLAGDIVRTIEPHSEADPAAILIQALAAFGNVIGRTAHFRAEADRHFANLFACLVGTTSKGRKGTSWGHVRWVFELASPSWCQDNVTTGLSSGEGLIWAVRDPAGKDDGIQDKRLFVLEAEFASTLAVCQRERNTLSAIMRCAWDTGTLRTLAKNSPAVATGAHVSIVSHVTREELRRLIGDTNMANGMANRFLWVCARRSKSLPEGGNLSEDELEPLALELRQAQSFAETQVELRRNEAARVLWHDVYEDLSEGKPGLAGAATSRAEAQVMRLALIYALLDRSRCIERQHLEAGLAVWRYCERSAEFIFGLDDDVILKSRALEWLQTHRGPVTACELRNGCRWLREDGAAERVLDGLVSDRRGHWQESQSGTTGRPARRFALGPKSNSSVSLSLKVPKLP